MLAFQGHHRRDLPHSHAGICLRLGFPEIIHCWDTAIGRDLHRWELSIVLSTRITWFAADNEVERVEGVKIFILSIVLAVMISF